MDLQKIKKQVEEVLEFSQGFKGINAENLINEWYDAKEFFIERFGGPIYQFPEKTVFHMSDDNKESKFRTFIAHIYDRYELYSLGRYLESRTVDEFFNNTVQNEYIYMDVVIPKGMKLLKSFKFFSDNDHLISAAQTEASAILAEDKIEGYFCLSVHPLDFLSSSENTYNWRSCHALNGEYRAGNLSYMCDSSTIVCYIKGDNDESILPRFPESVPWNSKKWRMLMFLSDAHNALYAGRQYPFILDNILPFARDILFRTLEYSPGRWSGWHNDLLPRYIYKDSFEAMEFQRGRYESNYSLVPIGGKFYRNVDLITDVPGSRHFDDLLYSSYYTPYYCYRLNSQEDIHFTIGSHVHCIKCGKNDPAEGRMVCRDCEREYGDEVPGYYVCDICGARIPQEEGTWIARGDMFVCDSCYENECSTCYECGEVYPNDSMYYDDNNCRWYCSSCWDEAWDNS